MEEVVDDISDIAFKYSQSLLRGADNSEIALINDGLGKVSNHLRKKIGQQGINNPHSNSLVAVKKQPKGKIPHPPKIGKVYFPLDFA